MAVLLLCGWLVGQAAPSSSTGTGSIEAAKASPPPSSAAKSGQLVIPAGTKVPLILKHAISTKATREGDAVYAQTTFPVAVNDHILIPPGTYVQGRISHVQRAGRVKGRAEVLMHFTTLIYPNGYTVMLPGSLENAPGVDKTSVKDDEGTLRGDSQTGEKLGKVASAAGTGAIIGAVTNGGKGAGVGAGVGGAVGMAIAMLSRGNDLKLDTGTSIEMVIQRDVVLEGHRIVAEKESF
jgi:type IV secretion system protein VirB10